MIGTKHKSENKAIKRIIVDYMSKYRRKLTISIVFLFVLSLSTWGYTYSLKPLFDDVIGEKNIEFLYWAPALLLLMTGLKSVAMYFSRFFMEEVSQNVIADLQKDLYANLIYKKQSFFADNNTSSLTSRFTFDLAKMSSNLANIISTSSRNIAMLFGYLLNLFFINWQLAIISLIIFPVSIIPIKVFTKYIRKYARRLQEKTGVLADVLNESFSLIKQIKIYCTEEKEIARTNTAINHALKYTIKAIRLRILSSPVMEIIGTMSFCVVFVTGAKLVIAGDLTQGEFVSFITTLLLLYQPVKGMGNINSYLQDAAISASRTFEVIDSFDNLESGNITFKGKAQGKIEFKNVNFLYPDGNRALDGLNFTIKPGQSVAFVGFSGSGKTTALNLIPRLFDTTIGQVLVDDIDVKDLQLKELRKNISIVSQETGLFNASIKENVKYGVEDASDEDVINACKRAQADEFIQKQEFGYDTQVGEAGLKLSGGQRQRILIARAILNNRPILLLDEATSALDTQAERKIQTAINEVMAGKTSILVAHRLSTVVNCDIIYVMKDGVIIEQGSHSDLLKLNGEYAKLYNLQH